MKKGVNELPMFAKVVLAVFVLGMFLAVLNYYDPSTNYDLSLSPKVKVPAPTEITGTALPVELKGNNFVQGYLMGAILDKNDPNKVFVTGGDPGNDNSHCHEFNKPSIGGCLMIFNQPTTTSVLIGAFTVSEVYINSFLGGLLTNTNTGIRAAVYVERVDVSPTYAVAGTRVWVAQETNGKAVINTDNPPTYDLTKNPKQSVETYLRINGADIPIKFNAKALTGIRTSLTNPNYQIISNTNNTIININRGGQTIHLTEISFAIPKIASKESQKLETSYLTQRIALPATPGKGDGTFKIIIQQNPKKYSWEQTTYSLLETTFIPTKQTTKKLDLSIVAQYRGVTGKVYVPKPMAETTFLPGADYPSELSYTTPQRLIPGGTIRVTQGLGFYNYDTIKIMNVPRGNSKTRTITFKSIVFPGQTESGEYTITIYYTDKINHLKPRYLLTFKPRANPTKIIEIPVDQSLIVDSGEPTMTNEKTGPTVLNGQD